MQTLKYQTLKPILELGESSLIFKRFRHGINPMRPKMPTWKRKLMVEFAAPRFTEKHPTTQYLWQECPLVKDHKRREKKSIPNPYEAIFVDELKDHLNKSKMIGILHFNDIDKRGYRRAWQTARRLKMDLESYERVMVRGAVKDTQWENLAFFLDGLHGKNNQRFLFSPEMNAKDLLQFEKKCPEAFLMAAVFENRILSRQEVEKVSKMPDKEHLLAETLAILNSPAQKTLSLLNSNQQNLSTQLTQYIKDQSEK